MPLPSADTGRLEISLGSGVWIPKYLALLCTEASVYLCGPSSLWRLGINNKERHLVADLPLPWGLREAAHFRLLRRLGRLWLRELIQLYNGDLLGIVRRSIVRLAYGSKEFQTVFRVERGGRPTGFCLTPQGHIFVGEYRAKRQHKSLRIWGSLDNGVTWDVAHVFPVNYPKHIHNIIWDPFRQGMWILTGDHDEESAFLFTADEFKTVTEFVKGRQEFRACHLFCQPDGLYYGTDSERAPNWFVHLDINPGELTKLQPLPGSFLYGARLAGKYFLSTTVEPSKVNLCKRPALWVSADLSRWQQVMDFEKDRWPAGAFGFGTVMLPKVTGNCPLVIFSTN
jgi:hypothetical protein